jgi:hypothetical protein
MEARFVMLNILPAGAALPLATLVFAGGGGGGGMKPNIFILTMMNEN